MAAPCMECHARPKVRGRHRCATCLLRTLPIGEQVAASAARLAMVPEPLRVKRTPKLMRSAPEGRAWCASCQSWRDDEDFGKNATRCRACVSAAAHGAMIEKTYGIGGSEYARLLALQGGKCAICRARPKSKRLAVDHDHATNAVRGLLCKRCNRDLLGAAHDGKPILLAGWHYLNTPPSSGVWVAPEAGQAQPGESGAQRPSNAFGKPSGGKPAAGAAADVAPSVFAPGWRWVDPVLVADAYAAFTEYFEPPKF